jgi:hypothetical protein
MNEEQNKESLQSNDDNQQPEPQLNTPSTDEPIVPVTETSTEAEQPPTYNSQLTTPENMEVHHHAHDPAAPHHKKNWKSYFWEFLMLFLAVFCGFLAEYQLEHTIENQREKKYIVSLAKDVELDIASLENSYELRNVQISYFDSLASLLKQDNKEQMNDFYFYSRHITRSILFRYHDRTIQQLKNSGNFRLIRNTKVADSITVYDNVAVKTVLGQQEFEEEFRREIGYDLVGKVLDAAVWDEMSDSNGIISRPVNNPFLITQDPILINEFHFKVVQITSTLRFTNRFTRSAITSAQNLLHLLKTEYHLK